MVSEGWLLVKDGDVVGIGRIAADLRRSAANFVRLDARVGEGPLMSAEMLMSSLDIGNQLKRRSLRINWRVDQIILLRSN
jgi:hypothetical protein